LSNLNTIYQQIKDLSLGILTHEMVYAVIDHYFVKRSPPTITRMLHQLYPEQTPISTSQRGKKVIAQQKGVEGFF